MNPLKKYNSKYIWLLLKVSISGVLLTYLLVTIPVKDIYSVIISAELTYVLLALLLAFPIQYLSAFQTHYLTRVQGMSISVMQILKVHLITIYYGLFLPGILSGGAVKWYKFSKFGTRSSAAAVVILNRFIETFIIILVGLLFLIPGLSHSADKNSLLFLTLMFLFLIMLYLFLFNKKTNFLIIRVLYKYHFPKVLKTKIHNFLIAMDQYRALSFKDHIEINGIVFFYNLLGILAFYCFARAMHINVDIFTLGWIRSALAIISLLPFSFAGFGIREGSLVVLLSQYGVHPQSAMALSFLLFLRTLLNAGFGGILDMFPSSEKGKDYFILKSADEL